MCSELKEHNQQDALIKNHGNNTEKKKKKVPAQMTFRYDEGNDFPQKSRQKGIFHNSTRVLKDSQGQLIIFSYQTEERKFFSTTGESECVRWFQD